MPIITKIDERGIVQENGSAPALIVSVPTIINSELISNEFLTQTTWCIDSVNGNDRNDGLTQSSALLTLGELTRRLAGRVYSPTVTTVVVNLYGTFPLDTLVINFCAVSQLTVSYYGQKTTVDNGTVTSYQAWSSSTDLRAQLTDSSQDFSTHVRKRIRLTSGTGSGALTWIGSTSGNTVANIGQFRTTTWPTGSDKTPSNGDSYVIETLDTSILQFEYRCSGPVRAELYDLDISTKAAYPSAGSIMRCIAASHTDSNIRVLGCAIGCVTGSDPGFRGTQQWISCGLYGPASSGLGIYLFEGSMNFKALCCFTSLHVYRDVVVTAYAMYHDGNLTHYVGTNVQEGSIYRVLSNTFDAYFGCVGGISSYDWLIRTSNGSQVIMSTSYFWGSGSNGTAVALEVENGCGFYYSSATKPKAVGATPGSDVKLAGGTPIGWSSVPAVALSPNNAAILEKS